MLEDARKGKIDLIITKSISRFARNTLDTLVVIRELKNLGIEVYFDSHNLSSYDPKCEVLLSIIATISQEESRNLSDNIKWGLVRKMENGDFTLPYKRFLGYKKGEDGRPQIIKKEARIIKRIYYLFLNNVSIDRICKILEKKDVESLGHKDRWHYSTVHSILTNEK